jgi:hypothetical protein
MKKSYSLHEFRKMVTARDKALAVSKPIPEGVKYLSERYKATEDTAFTLIDWLRKVPSGGEPGSTTVNPTEQWHLKFDEAKGAWVKIDDREEAKKSEKSEKPK